MKEGIYSLAKVMLSSAMALRECPFENHGRYGPLHSPRYPWCGRADAGFFQRLDYTQTGGAPLLGINGLSIVCHGSSKREAVYNGLRIAEDCYNKNIIEMQQLELSKISG